MVFGFRLVSHKLATQGTFPVQCKVRFGMIFASCEEWRTAHDTRQSFVGGFCCHAGWEDAAGLVGNFCHSLFRWECRCEPPLLAMLNIPWRRSPSHSMPRTPTGQFFWALQQPVNMVIDETRTITKNRGVHAAARTRLPRAAHQPVEGSWAAS